MFDIHELNQVVNEFLPIFRDEITVDYTDELKDGIYSFKVSINGKTYSFSHNINKDDIKSQIKFFTKNDVYDALVKYTDITIPWGSHTGVRPVALAVKLIKNMSLNSAIDKLKTDYRMSDSKARLCVDIANNQQPFLNTDNKNIDIYISIPFCVTRCNYCSFSLIGIEKKGNLHKAYTDKLCEEIDAVSKAIKSNGYIPRNLYFGGGTPTAISHELLRQVLNSACSAFPNVKEFTMEAGRADTIDEEKLKVMADFPITRFNINPQSMIDNTLMAIGRNHTSQDVIDVFNMVRAYGYNNINMDIIAGLPNETLENFIYTTDKILELNPECITVHTFALKRASKLKKQAYSIKGNSVADKMMDYAYKVLMDNEYKPYYLYRQKNMEDNGENVGFAKAGYECVYNIDIMEENTHILALGSGAVSKRIIQDGLIRRSDPKDIEVYIDRIDDTIKKSIEFFS